MAQDKIFADGISCKEASEKTPWVKARLGIGKKFIEFYEKNKDERGWVNVDICESRNKTLYAELNTWKPNGQNQIAKQSMPNQHEVAEVDSIPF